MFIKICHPEFLIGSCYVIIYVILGCWRLLKGFDERYLLWLIIIYFWASQLGGRECYIFFQGIPHTFHRIKRDVADCFLIRRVCNLQPRTLFIQYQKNRTTTSEKCDGLSPRHALFHRKMMYYPSEVSIPYQTNQTIPELGGAKTNTVAGDGGVSKHMHMHNYVSFIELTVGCSIYCTPGFFCWTQVCMWQSNTIWPEIRPQTEADCIVCQVSTIITCFFGLEPFKACWFWWPRFLVSCPKSVILAAT